MKLRRNIKKKQLKWTKNNIKKNKDPRTKFKKLERLTEFFKNM